MRRAVSSGFTAFENSAIVVFGALRVTCHLYSGFCVCFPSSALSIALESCKAGKTLMRYLYLFSFMFDTLFYRFGSRIGNKYKQYLDLFS